ncbi:FadR/GntR family transcriptional regulator [Roseateles sp.]|uniref:FadR/GntR family transcriptional regulator n=1 Tax=Roseateles sp. TaxID=1971397 RepID=UPI002E00F2C6|nr:FadR/GntR family transcriptional regulator [Roseateles sp.]
MSLPLPSQEAPRQHQLVAERIRSLIALDHIAMGSRLPSERELALRLGVSRQTVREALIALEIDGHVDIRGGSGVYVCATAKLSTDVAPLVLGESPEALANARAVLESSVASLAAARQNEDGLRRVEEALQAMRDDVAVGRRPIESDRLFHVCIAEMCGNAVLAALVGVLFDGRNNPATLRLCHRSESAATWRAAIAEHEVILGALKGRDPQSASAAMDHHLRASVRRWTEGPAA